MTVTLELTPEEVAALTAHAGTSGTDIVTTLRRLIAAIADAPRPASPFFGYGAVEKDDSEERAEHEREAMEMQNNIRRWREEQRR